MLWDNYYIMNITIIMSNVLHYVQLLYYELLHGVISIVYASGRGGERWSWRAWKTLENNT